MIFRDTGARNQYGSAGNATARGVYDDVVIVPHHPDRLRRPSPRAGARDDDYFLHTLTWNVFRTLELLPPAFWLRRLHAYLVGEASGAAAQTVKVSLWPELSLPPAQHIDGARPHVVADVIIETEHAVWGFMAATTNDVRWLESETGRADIASQVIDAASWFAGTRDCHIGLIQSTGGGTLSEDAAVSRYARSRDSLWLRSGSKPDSLSNVRGVGVLRWTQFAAILQDCAQALILTDMERALARNALAWLAKVGVVDPEGRRVAFRMSR